VFERGIEQKEGEIAVDTGGYLLGCWNNYLPERIAIASFMRVRVRV